MATMSSRDRVDPADLTVEEAAERFVGRKRGALADATVREYGYRLRRFREWCDDAGVERVGDLHPLDFDDFLASREADGVQPITLKKHFRTIREFVEFLEALGAVDDGLSDAVPDVDVPRGGAVNTEQLEPDEGDRLVAWFRNGSQRASRHHVLLELIWFTGCRAGAVRGLDIDDFDIQTASVAFRHRPDTDTPLKKGIDGERIVALPAETVDVITEYIREHRHGVRDDHGRRPLLASERGRPSVDTIRTWCYYATEPCLYGDCPHGKSRDTCEWTNASRASHCPSSRAPTPIKTGAITRMLNRGVEKERVKHRANTSQWPHYDQASQAEQMEERDRAVVPDLELDTETEGDN